MEEGYCFIRGIFTKRLNSILSNELVHPEIFRRMAEYGVNMDTYWSHWREELRRATDQIARNPLDLRGNVEDFPRLFAWHFVGSVAEPFLAQLKECCPDLAKTVGATAVECDWQSFRSPESYTGCLQIVRQHWEKFARTTAPTVAADLADSIRDSRLCSLSEWRSEASDAKIYENLSVLGLVREGGTGGEPSVP